MNYVIVRTRLQAIFALELLRSGRIAKPFTLIELYQFNVGEDSKSVYQFYDLLAEQANKRLSIIQANGFWMATARLLFACCHAKSTGGKLYVAVVDFYPLSVALKLCPGFNVTSFDDGTANTQVRNSSYHSTTPLSGKGVKRRLARLFFPNGSSYFVRSRIDQHYTLYPQEENIVPPEKCTAIELNWANHLHPSDKLKLPNHVNKIMLGTIYDAYPDTEKVDALKTIRDDILSQCDLYIPHPREKLTFDSPKIFNLNSPAESLIEFLISKHALTVYHFNSSAVLNFVENKKLQIIDLNEIAFRKIERE